MNWTIKHFNELSTNELYEIIKSRLEVFTEEQQVTEQDLDDKDKDNFHLFAIENGRVVAYCRLLRAGVSYEEPSIGRVAVLKSHRRRGIAEEMMLEGIKFIKSEFDVQHITLSGQVYAKGLYKKVGFSEYGEIYDEAGIPHIKMKL